MRFPLPTLGGLPAFVAIYHRDGTVAISHGGIECGQGVNTKAAQVAAYTLGIPFEMVSIKPSNNLIGANATFTGGSVTTDMVCYVCFAIIPLFKIINIVYNVIYSR